MSKNKIKVPKAVITAWKTKRRPGDVTRIAKEYSTTEKLVFASSISDCINQGFGTPHVIECIEKYYSNKKQ